MQASVLYRLLVLVFALVVTAGCLSRKRAKWHPPIVAMPSALNTYASFELADAEIAYAHAVDLEKCGDEFCVDYYFQAATNAWLMIEQQIMDQGAPFGRPAKIYQSSLTKLITTGQKYRRLVPRQNLLIRSAQGEIAVPTSHHGFVWQPQDFDQVVPVGEYSTKEIRNRYCCSGIGVSVIVVHCRRPNELFRRTEQTFAATVVLRPTFDSNSAKRGFELAFLDPLRVATTTVAGQRVSITRDISAPIVYRLSQAEREYLRLFLQPGSTTENLGLFMIEPYQPRKIPVVFVHGLMSDPFTWANIANEIRARPDLLERYQIWGFEYATGEPFLTSASVLRRQLQQAKAFLDSGGSDEAWSRVVLVGHSMGGLISKLQISHSGAQLWNAVSSRPLDQIVTTAETRRSLSESFFFEPLPYITRVVFVGTPHRGSPWAERPVGRLGARLVREPSSLQNEHRQLIGDNPNTFSREFVQRVPTSVDLLEPDSRLLQAINQLPTDPHVRLHSIVGSGYWMIGAGNSDKVVPVSSARIHNATTERFVNSKHTDLHKDDDGVEELLCILRRHVSEFGSSWENGGTRN